MSRTLVRLLSSSSAPVTWVAVTGRADSHSVTGCVIGVKEASGTPEWYSRLKPIFYSASPKVEKVSTHPNLVE